MVLRGIFRRQNHDTDLDPLRPVLDGKLQGLIPAREIARLGLRPAGLDQFHFPTLPLDHSCKH